ncbi:D-beta-hydroxybutyrate dehydrogenase, mitochondrial-like isoform X2 [Lineus longissimus]
MSATIAALCGGVIVGLWLQGSCICVGLIALAGIGYAVYNSSLFHGKSVPVGEKAVLITGCDSGFGKWLAEKLDALGFTVIACCMFPDKGGADDLRRKCSSRLHILRLDVTSNEDVNAAVKYVKDKIGNGLWALVNNAGISWTGETEWTDVSTYEKIYSVNVFGVIRVTKAFLPLIRKTRGRVVNVASMAGRFALSGFSAYCSSKFACIGFSDALRREMRKFGVTVHTIEPAFYK